MRFKKGEKVEVINQKEAPVSWRVAHVLSGNGHMYRVVYDSSSGWANVRVVETVSRKFMRPCPPLVQGVENCVSGDIVEVFHEFSWKIAVILKVARLSLGDKRTKIGLKASTVRTVYSVRLLGCSQELVIDSFNMRNRQTWHDEKWVLMEKDSQQGDDVLACHPSTSNHDQKMNVQFSRPNPSAKRELQRNSMNIKWDATFRDEAQHEHVRKFRATEEDRKIQRVAAAQVTEKVDVISYPKELLGENGMHASCNIISNGHNQMERAEVNSEISNSDSDACSVGSCSVNYQSQNYLKPYLPCQESESVFNDAELCCGSGTKRKNGSFYSQEDVETNVHVLELQAYRSTLEAFYAFGSLSWEQEALLTNLRIMLRISNDEQLIELKSLVSARTSVNGNSWMQMYCFQWFKEMMLARVCRLSLGMNFWAI